MKVEGRHCDNVWSQDRSSKDRSGQDRSSQDRSGQVESGQVLLRMEFDSGVGPTCSCLFL